MMKEMVLKSGSDINRFCNFGKELNVEYGTVFFFLIFASMFCFCRTGVLSEQEFFIEALIISVSIGETIDTRNSHTYLVNL